MRILLDTHVLLWAISTPERLSGETLSAIENAESIFFSAASIWEIAIKAGLGYAGFTARPEEVAEEALDIGFVELPVQSSIAARVMTLPRLHRDPFDRLLVVQAMALPAILFTADRHLPAYTELVQLV
jgi:PIN domain nuclease of toxin-antitoxin system